MANIQIAPLVGHALHLNRLAKARAELGAYEKRWEKEIDGLAKHYQVMEEADVTGTACTNLQNRIAELRTGPESSGQQDITALETEYNKLASTYKGHIAQRREQYHAEKSAMLDSQDQQRTLMQRQIDDLQAALDQHSNTHVLHGPPSSKEEHTPPSIEGPSDSPKQYDKLNEKFSTVVFADGQWHEIACCFCGANVSAARRHPLFSGWDGLKKHIERAHAPGWINEMTLFRQCKGQTFSHQDVQSMRRGFEPSTGAVVEIIGSTVKKVTMKSMEPFDWDRAED